MINSATPHDFALQEILSDFSRCSFYFRGRDKNENLARATLRGENVLLFNLNEKNGAVDVFITIPDNFNPTHYYRDIQTSDTLTKDAHLSYHGKRKGKKISGEIHLISNRVNQFSGASNKIAAPLATAKDIEKYPLPICRIELNLQAGSCDPRKDTSNFFELHTGEVFLNTIEVHLARAGFLHSLASCSPSVSPVLGSIFIHTSMRTFYLNKMDRRPGLYPQALALETQNYELIILALHEYRNPEYRINALRYFHTENYFKDLASRNHMQHAGGWFVDSKANEPEKAGFRRLTSLLR
jgi:hypothetical protein